jgi:hypothetical protein
MGYERPQWILQPEHISYHLREEALPYLCRKENFLYLEQLLCLDEETLYLLTLHRFAPILQRGTEQPLPQKATLIARALLSDGSSFAEPLYTKVCPTCLDQPDGYDRLYRRAAFIVLCPDHLLLLRTNCPHCKKHIPALRAALGPFCKQGDYRAPTAHMPEESVLLKGELLIFRALGVPCSKINAPPDGFTDSPLLGLNPVDYFHLYRSMIRTLSHLVWPEDIPM